MKKLFLIATLLACSTSWAQDSMTPLSEYLEQQQNHFDDPNVLLYITTRCSAIYFVMGDLSGDNSELMESAKNASMLYLTKATLTRKMITNDSDQQNLQNIMETIKAVADAYIDVINPNYVKTGMYFTDWMLDDLSNCSFLSSTINK